MEIGWNLGSMLVFVVIGFVAQMIDGAMGMAYGVSCRTFLKTVAGLPTALSSAVVHCSEVFTTLVSGISHIKFKNVSKDIFWRLLVPGVIGGILGAWFVTSLGSTIEAFIDAYLIIMGLIIFSKAFKKIGKEPRKPGKYIYPLGFVGGFMDATGGGGWGPIVTSTLIASGHDAKKTIGSVNTAEFIVTMAETTTFVALISDFTQYLPIVVGLIIGGVIAAPLAAYVCTKIPVKPLLIIVGALVVVLNVINLIQCF